MNQFVGLGHGQDEEHFVELIVVIRALCQGHMRPRDGIERRTEDAEAPSLGGKADPGRCGAEEAQTWRLGGVIRPRFMRCH